MSYLLKLISRSKLFNNLTASIFNLLFSHTRVKGEKNKISRKGAYLKKVKIDVVGDNNEVTIGSLSFLENCTVTVRGSNHKLHFGSNTRFKNTTFQLLHNCGEIIILDKTTISGALVLSGEGNAIEIGEDCMLSSGIDIRTTDSHSIISLEKRERINHGSDVVIGNHVWIGNSSKIWKGANIGENSVIGTGSMVSKKIPKNVVAAGTPVKIIKENTTWDRELL